MRFPPPAALCFLTLFATALPAQADSGRVDVHIHIHHVSIELVDLEPGDGIAPGVAWGDRTGRGNVYLGEGPYGASDELLGPGRIALSSRASASSFEAGETSWRLHASSAARITGATYVGGFFDARMSFTLTPHTGMFVRAIADADAASDVARSSLLVHAGIGAYAGASSFFDSLTSSEPLSTSHPLFGYVHSDADGSLGGIEIRGSSAILIAAEPPIPGIPEPSSWALLAAGLGVLAVARRTARRRGARVG